ncbi:MAG: DUF4388 domain-containing protein [Myxococcota bacterium]
MGGPILIVGDPGRRSSLSRRVAALGYPIEESGLADLTRRVREGVETAAVMLCAEGPAAAAVMADLRRTRRGVSIPVTLCGRLGGAIRDLADVLDLGADQFLEEPFDDESLASTLAAIAGSPGTFVEAFIDPPTAVGEDPAPSTEMLSRGTDAGDVSRSGSYDSVDPAIGRLGRTLDLLEARLRSRSGPAPGESSDELEMSLLGLAPAPPVEIEDPLDAPALTHSGAATRPQVAWGNETAPVARPHAAPISPIESTTRLEGVSSTHARPARTGRRREPTGSGSGGVTERPRRRVRLSVERQGDVSTLEVPRLLWSLHRSRFTGRIDLEQGRVRKQLWIEHGDLVFAGSSLPDDRLVNTLVRRGVLTRAQHDAARSLAAKDPRRVGKLLVEAGFLKPDELPSAIRAQVQSIAASTFGWGTGQWSLEDEDRCEEAVRLEDSLARLIMQGVCERLERDTLLGLLGGGGVYPLLRPGARPEELGIDLGLESGQRRLLGQLDGRRDLDGLCERSVLSDRLVLATVYGLHVLGLAELSEEALASGEGVDPEALDRVRIEERLKLVREADYFQILGLPRDAGAADVRRAHREVRITFEDDAVEHGTRDALRRELLEIRAALDDALQLLCEDDLRLAYLAHLEVP